MIKSRIVSSNLLNLIKKNQVKELQIEIRFFFPPLQTDHKYCGSFDRLLPLKASLGFSEFFRIIVL